MVCKCGNQQSDDFLLTLPVVNVQHMMHHTIPIIHTAISIHILIFSMNDDTHSDKKMPAVLILDSTSYCPKTMLKLLGYTCPSQTVRR